MSMMFSVHSGLCVHHFRIQCVSLLHTCTCIYTLEFCDMKLKENEKLVCTHKGRKFLIYFLLTSKLFPLTNLY